MKKREPLKNELRALFSTFRAWLHLRDIEREADRKAAGITSNEEQRAARARWRASE